MDNDIDEWLDGLPAGDSVEVDGETLYLNVGIEGVELGIFLYRNYTTSQLLQAMKVGFQSALQYDAGLGMKDDALVLTQWVPGAQSWKDVAGPLENLLNQVEMWRERLGPENRHQDNTKQAERVEQRLRKLFAETR